MLCWGSHEEIPNVKGKRNTSKTVGDARGHQRADTLKPYSQKTSQSNHTRTTALYNSLNLSHAYGATQDGPGTWPKFFFRRGCNLKQSSQVQDSVVNTALHPSSPSTSGPGALSPSAHTLDMGYLFMAAPAKHSLCSLPWTRGIPSLLPLLTLNVE